MEHGIKETKEVLTGVLEVVKVLAVELKDGFQVQDLIEAFKKLEGDTEKKAKLEAALKQIVEVPTEVKDLTFKEGIELAVHVLAEVPALIEAFKKA
jgi:uncharacterized protein (DUF2336 family)